MNITTLIENNTACQADGLAAEHGLSLHIEHAGKPILFDTGATGAFASNAARLGIDLDKVDAAVLSHHHFDHGGGLETFFDANDHAPVYLRRPPEGRAHFRALHFLGKDIGLSHSLFEKHNDRFSYVDGFREVLPDLILMTRISHRHPLPGGNRYLYLERDGRRCHDPFEHELMLVVRADTGLVVFTGCSHNGALNMIDTVLDRFPGETVRAVIGGFHLVGLPMFNGMAGGRSTVRKFGHALADLPVERFWTGHCTGRKAFNVLHEILGDRLAALNTGSRIVI